MKPCPSQGGGGRDITGAAEDGSSARDVTLYTARIVRFSQSLEIMLTRQTRSDSASLRDPPRSLFASARPPSAALYLRRVPVVLPSVLPLYFGGSAAGIYTPRTGSIIAFFLACPGQLSRKTKNSSGGIVPGKVYGKRLPRSANSRS